ncbi:MAG: glycosyltransferase family 4 protein [Deltaproteobacteria bacterium]|nr:glycosyltransferase family 4 protein [Deltaproteobacteria bacterium]
MKIALFAPGYPSDAEPYNFAFVHARARLYAAQGHEVSAFSMDKRARYTLDAVPVVTGDGKTVERALLEFKPDVIAVHGPVFRMIDVLERIDLPQVSWIHGHEALFSLRSVSFGKDRLQKMRKLLTVVPRSLYQVLRLRRFLTKQHATVFVSRWMLHAAERHTFERYPNATIIPNPIDTERFTYRLDLDKRHAGVTARGLSSSKYGLDLAIRAFAGPLKVNTTFEIIGRGTLEAKLGRLIQATGSRAKLIAQYVPHRDMPELLGRYGYFVAPSRVEAQGVAMCEAMACGLPIIATTVGGIPEFVTNEQEGLLVPPENPEAIRAAVERLLSDPSLHLKLSKNARARMERQCSPIVVIARELDILAGASKSRSPAHSL